MTETKPRFHSMDGLRALAMILGIFFHAALSFVPTAQIWWITEDVNSNRLYYFIYFYLHSFRMPLFYMIAGFFAHMVYHRVGLGGFTLHRAKRILIPFVVGCATLVPILHCVYIYRDFFFASTDIFPEFLVVSAGYLFSNAFLDNFTPAHLWFLYYLMMLYILGIATSKTAGRVIGETGYAKIDRCFEWLTGSFWKPLILAVPTMFFIYLMPEWFIETPDKGLVPNFTSLAFYSLFFGFGWLLHRQTALLEAFRKHMWTYCVAALLIFLPISASLQPIQYNPGHEAFHLAEFASIALLSISIWLLIFGLTGLFERYLNDPNRTTRYISDSSYWLYLVHLQFVMFLQVLFARMEMAAIWKFLFISLITLAVCFITYHLLVRYTFIGYILNGPRYRATPGPRSVDRE